MVVSLQQTLIIPQLPELPRILDITPDDATWLVTATLLTAAVATPIVSRTADMYGKRRMLVVSLAVLTAGSLIAVVGQTFPFLVAGRAMQGFASALIPVGISILRDELPKERVGQAIALMSGTLGIGSALGLPLSGVISQAFGWEAIFWFSATVGAALAVAVMLRVPESRVRTAGTFDVPGAILLSVALIALLLGISKGTSWGWLSSETVSAFVIAVVALAAWVPLELRVNQPMVDLRTLAIRPVLLTNIATLFVGISMYANMLVTTQILEVPEATGYGLGLPIALAGLTMVPSGLTMLAISPAAGVMLTRWGGKPTLLLGAAVMALAYLYRVLAGGSVWEIVVGVVAVSLGTALALAALPALVMNAVPITETASANGANTLVRYVGTSVSSAVIALIIVSQFVTVDGVDYPSESAIQTVFTMAAVAAAVAVVIVLFIPSMRRSSLSTAALTAQEPLVLPSTSGGAGTEQVVGGRVVLGTTEGMRRNAVVSIVTVEGKPIDWARADNEGRYRIALPGAGRYVAIANAQGWTPASRVFVFDGGSSIVDLLLTVPLAIAGVVTTDMVGHEGALVVLTRSGGEFVAATVSGPDGGYNFPLPPQGSYVVTAVDFDGDGAVSRKCTLATQSVELNLDLYADLDAEGDA
ncbi:MFS transporter [Microbacterium sp. LMI11-1-1.1]